ncbi:nucleotidyltransferase domain-containing protein [Candidatus Woesearchaeota archaeon]|nr:nucleotidyltransferase domain-containing protein [Candidatus Woesearchaeota archaeon]
MKTILTLNKLEAEILYIFAQNFDLKITILQLTKKIKNYYANVYNTIKSLQKRGLLKIESIGMANICSLNINSLELPVFMAFIEEISSLQILKKLPFIRRIIEEIKNISPISSIGIFGSYASESATLKSDIDLFILTDKTEKFKNFIPRYFPEFENCIDLNVISFEEFIESQKSKEFTVSKEIVKNKIILMGAELFYQIIQEARK